MRHACSIGIMVLTLAAGPAAARNDGRAGQLIRVVPPPAGATDNPRNAEVLRGLAALAASDTTWLHAANFDSGVLCNPQGWTAVDRTAPTGTYWHVDDYAGLPFGPVAGTKSLWCGARPASDPIHCAYLTLPGYGNSWDQMWCTKNCLAVAGGATTGLDISFTLRYDSEPSYDGTTLEYSSDCSGAAGWIEIDGDHPSGWSGVGTINVSNSYNVGSGPVKVRLRFRSDTSWSDEDGFYNSNGAAHVDNLKAEDLATETFEDESVGATSANDWQSCNLAYGTYAALVHGSELVQLDPCIHNVSCLWAFIQGSQYNYACGGYPAQRVVPYVNSSGQYLNNEIRSPQIPLSGSGSGINLQFDVYRDNPLDALIFYVWYVRTVVNGCPTAWKNNNSVNEAKSRGWLRQTVELGPYVNLANATHIQVALGVIDMCPFWCGIFGTGQCHSDAPLFDNIKVYRVNTSGPLWGVRGIDLFQDTFPANGTITGKGRASSGMDISNWGTPGETPGDSSIVLSLLDPNYANAAAIPVTNSSGLSDDPNISTFIGRHKTKKQVYMWVSVWPQGQPGKSGDALSEGPGGQANRYPHIAGKDYVDGSGVTWTAIRGDYTYTGNSSNAGDGHPAPNAPPYVANRFNVDVNDNLFTPGDTVCFFYGATSPGGTSYYSDQWHVTNSIAEVAANPMEFTILPAGGFNRGGDILYVDGADGFGSQPYFEGAFLTLGLEDKIDRFDVRNPDAKANNTLAARVYNVAAQLNACYRGIVYDAGSLSGTVGDGEQPESDDYALFNTFLNNVTNGVGGIYLSGDDVAQDITTNPTPSQTTFRTLNMPFNLASGDHVAAGMGVSPAIVHWPGRYFSDDFFVFGGCPDMNDFDVLNASGTSRVEMSYGSAQSASGAVLSNSRVNANGAIVTVMLSGFSFAYIRDDETNGISDRAQFLRDVLVPIVSGLPQVTPAGPVRANSLAQNYPNPFNPQTTIAFSINARSHVSLKVFDVNGALVRTLADGIQTAGAHEVRWDGRDDRGASVSSGVYFYRLSTGSFTQTRKMVLLK